MQQNSYYVILVSLLLNYQQANMIQCIILGYERIELHVLQDVSSGMLLFGTNQTYQCHCAWRSVVD